MTVIGKAGIVVAAILGGWMVSPGSIAAPAYDVRYAPEERRLYVQACFDPGPALRLRAADDEAARFLVFARGIDDRRIAPSGRRGLLVAASEHNRCVRYGVDLAAAAAEPSLRRAYGFEGNYLVWSGTWLWRPRQPLDGAQLVIRHPPGHGVSAPWPLVRRDADASHYRFDATPADWNNLVAFGPFEPFMLETRGGRLRVALLPGRPDANAADIRRWLSATGNAIASIYGELPLDEPQVLVVPIGRGREPVPWGQVRRGGGSAVHLFINQNEPLSAFLDDWTAAHEFSHLFHPYLGGNGRWLAEGMASYYQNISRARTGLLTPQEAWDKLHAGFQRGQRNTDGMTLRQANDDMRRERKFMRVYWSGAAFALLADVQLRQQHDTSLDRVLAQFRACHLPDNRIWPVTDFLAELDRLAGTKLFMDQYRRIIDSPDFPELAPAYAALGLHADGNTVRLMETGVTLRSAMTDQPVNAVVACPSRHSPLG